MKYKNMWKSCLFCLGGVEIVFEKGRIQKLFNVFNLGEELVYFYFYICVSYFFTCLSFHTCGDVFVKYFRKDRYILIKTFYLLLATSWLGSLRLEFVI